MALNLQLLGEITDHIVIDQRDPVQYTKSIQVSILKSHHSRGSVGLAFNRADIILSTNLEMNDLGNGEKVGDRDLHGCKI